jgi:hypothetical protein
LGKIAPDSNEENYGNHQYYIFFLTQWLFSKNPFFWAILHEYLNLASIKYESGGLFDKACIVGGCEYHVSGLALCVTYETPDHAISPNQGTYS